MQTTNVLGIVGDQSGILAIQQKLTPKLEFRKNRYVVLFNLDYSGSMAGSRWTQVCSAIQKFQNMLGEDDLIQGIVFNHLVSTVPHFLNSGGSNSLQNYQPKSVGYSSQNNYGNSQQPPQSQTQQHTRPQTQTQPQSQPQINNNIRRLNAGRFIKKNNEDLDRRLPWGANQ